MRIAKTFLISLLVAGSLSAANSHPLLDYSYKTAFLPFFNIDFNKIFFSGEDETVLFIDFLAVSNQLTSIALKQGEKTFMVDKVSDLPFNTIYELNLEVMRPGEYILELETDDGIKILKDIRVE